MDISLIPLVLTTIANLILGVYVYHQSMDYLANRRFGLFTLNLVAWSTCVILIANASTIRQAEVIGRLTFAVASFVPANFLAFTLCYPGQESPRTRQYHLYLLYGIAAIFCGISLTTLVQSSIKVNPWGYSPELGSAHGVYSLYMLVTLLGGLGVLARKYLRSKDQPVHRLQLRYLFLGMVFFVVPSLMSDIVLVRLSHPELYVLGPAFTIFLTGLTAYAITKYRLMGIQVALKKGLSYLIPLFLLGGVCALFFVFIPQTVLPKTGYHPLLITVLGIVSFLVAFQPMKESMHRLFFREQRYYQEALRSFSHAIPGVLDLAVLPRLLLTTIVQALKIERASLWLWDEEQNAYHRCHALGVDDALAPIPADSPLIEALIDTRTVLIKSEWERQQGARSNWRRTKPGRDASKSSGPVVEELVRIGAELCLPLLAQDRLLGVVCLSSKLIGGIYSDEDVGLLTTLANQAAIAIRNAQLHQSVVQGKQYVETILQNMESGMVAVSAKGEVQTANRAARQILTPDSEISLPQDIQELPPNLRDLLRHALYSGQSTEAVEIHVVQSEQKVPLMASTAPLKNEEGQVTGALTVFADISRLKMMEEQLIQTEKLASLGTLAAGLAHEVKNPLFSIKSFFQMYTELREDEEELNQFLHATETEVDRINQIVLQLLQLGRPSDQQFQWCDLNQLLEDTLLLLRKPLREGNIEVVDERTPTLPSVLSDISHMKQIFLNILLNAIQAMEQGGILTIRTSPGAITPQLAFPSTQAVSLGAASDSTDDVDDEMSTVLSQEPVGMPDLAGRQSTEEKWVTFCISDTGGGIPADQLQRIFDPFYTTKATGTGLGLTTVHSLVKNHGGYISVESHEGEGTTFILELPVSQQSLSEELPSSADAMQLTD